MILNETSYFGPGARAQVVEEVKRRGFRKALIVTDTVLMKAGVVGKVTQLLDAADLAYDIYDAVMPNPTIKCVTAGVAAFCAAPADYNIAN
ncbi:MAG: iron-containing alcohol dehydrogenase, partial [Acetobacteraceae bacterium]|nr:iron-containing alcohol dehydrogenase [Acetobacteraceae bacterium]